MTRDNPRRLHRVWDGVEVTGRGPRRAARLLMAAAVGLAAPGAAHATEGSGEPPPFTATISRIDDALKERMAHSWRRGCPVPRKRLRYLTVTHLRFDGTAAQGELVVHRAEATDVVSVFERLYEVGFKIKRMRLVDDYQGDDDASMAANNTSAFNCRRVTGGSSWSEHSYGRAVDINPVQNPYVYRGTVAPPAGAAYVDRTPHRKGMVGKKVRRAFAAIGWEWGGSWRSRKDYQHFSASGR
jgi:poly-gamma-glutamate synthesis protein (capsule biosynthesis protein)